MAIAPTVQRYLAREQAVYEVVSHPFAGCASETAHAAHVPGDRLAKAVLLRDGQGYLLAVLPASHHVQLAALRSWLGPKVALASEQEVGRWFKDCEVGAIPPLGDAYGLEVILDEGLAEAPEVCFEGGDHRSLVRVSGAQFGALMAGARHATFSRHD
jgi:Ala-tRNA(Pro) deacylase